MPMVNIGVAHTRSQVFGVTSAKVDSIGIGTDNAAEALTFTQLGTGAALSSWKNTAATAVYTDSSGTDSSATTSPWAQIEATWGTTEFNGNTVFEIGTAWGALSGENPAGEANSLYTRKRVGGATGLGKTSDYSLVARTKVSYPSS